MGKCKGLAAAGLRNLGQYAVQGFKRRKISQEDGKENIICITLTILSVIQ